MNYLVDKDACQDATVTTGNWKRIAGLEKYLPFIRKKRVKEDIKTLCTDWLRNDFGHRTELHYRKVEKGILFEEYLGNDPVCFKFYVINQTIEFISVQQYDVIKKWDIVDKKWNT